VGDGCQVGAGTLVISNLPSHSVAVGVPARVIGSFIDVTEQPSIEMNQMIDTSDNQRVLFASEGI
jgi:serine O-acetyltransferase